MQNYDVHHAVIERGGYNYPLNPLQGPGMRRSYPASDGFVSILPAVQRIDEWETLLKWMDSEGMAGDLMDPKWKDLLVVRREKDHLEGLFEAFTRSHTRQELFEAAHFRFPV
jgi:hypothetical protein